MRFLITLLLLLPAASGWAQGVQAFEINSLAQIEARHQGRPFVVLVWSMDCPFCHTSLEVLARARAANPQLEIVTISTDPLADQALVASAHAKLTKLSLLGDTWSFGSAPAERLRFALDPGWHGEKPRSYWYDASGRRIAYSGLIKAERLQKWQCCAGAPTP